MINFWRSAIRQQFHAAIDMLGNAIEACPNSVWSGQGQGAFWYLAFHTLFFLDLYLSEEDESRFHPPPPFGLTELAPGSVPPERAYRNGELLLYNMRHVQHHAAQLNMRLRQETDSAPKWVSKGGRKIGA